MHTFKKVLLGILVLAAVFNLGQNYLQSIVQANNHTTIPLHSLSYQFMGLEALFKDQRAIGYYTDKNLEHPLAVAQYEQAQYMLAPTVLDINNTNHRWVLLDCTSVPAALEAAKKFGLTPIKTNNGIILAVNPNL